MLHNASMTAYVMSGSCIGIWLVAYGFDAVHSHTSLLPKTLTYSF